MFKQPDLLTVWPSVTIMWYLQCMALCIFKRISFVLAHNCNLALMKDIDHITQHMTAWYFHMTLGIVTNLLTFINNVLSQNLFLWKAQNKCFYCFCGTVNSDVQLLKENTQQYSQTVIEFLLF